MGATERFNDSARQWFWRVGIKHVPTLKYSGFALSTAIWTVVSVWLAERSIDVANRYFTGASPAFWTLTRVGVAWLVVFLVLWINNLFIVAVFVGAFPRFIDRVSCLHHVTRAFGCELLRRFFEGEFDKAIFDDDTIASLPSVLQSLEAPHGCRLPMTAYALLLQKSSELRPATILATWDNEAFPIKDVFDAGTKEPNPPYARYFRALDDIYKNTNASSAKTRVFIFENETIRQFHIHGSDGKGSDEWAAVRRLHKRWGFEEIWHCTHDQLIAAKRSSAMMALEKIDDIVFFQERRNGSGWIVGMDRSSKSVVIRQENIELSTVREFFRALQSRSTSDRITPEEAAHVGRRLWWAPWRRAVGSALVASEGVPKEAAGAAALMIKAENAVGRESLSPPSTSAGETTPERPSIDEGGPKSNGSPFDPTKPAS
jgi:hypothetical protein